MVLVGFLSRALVVLAAYVVPAYRCFKAMEYKGAQRLRFWCQYWMVITIFTVLEGFLDAFVSWMPLYTSLKVFFIIYLWHPQTEGATPLYQSTVRPTVVLHQGKIDDFLEDAKDFARSYMESHLQQIKQAAVGLVLSSMQQQGVKNSRQMEMKYKESMGKN